MKLIMNNLRYVGTLNIQMPQNLRQIFFFFL